MKKFIIKVTTNWCNMDDSFRAVASQEEDLYDIAEELAYGNFESYNGVELMAESQGYNPETMEEEDWEALYENVCESDYYDFYIEEFKGIDEEWEEFGGEIYGEESDCIGE